MTEVSQTLLDRWRSRNHVGAAKPTQRVEIQRGAFHRGYNPVFQMLDGSDPNFGEIVGSKHNAAPWHPYWTAEGSWMDIPGVSSVQLGENVDLQSGVGEPATATITVENVAEVEATGVAGVFRRFERGHYAPMRGFQSIGRPVDPDAPQNEWFDMFTGGVKIRVWQGYGDAMEPVYVGLIDDCDAHSNPDTITITSRSFGQMLTDQRVFGWNKAAEIRPPVTFADRTEAFNTTKVSGGALASSHKIGHPASEVTKVGEDTYWMSAGHTIPAVTEWVEIHLPKGKYEEFYVDPMYDGMEMFLSIYGRTKGLPVGSSVMVNGTPVASGWIDVGLGNVPGEHGGYPYVKHWDRVSKGGLRRKIGLTLDCGDDTVLRIAFRNLGHSPSQNDYRAKVARLVGYRMKPKPSTAGKKHWVAVDDAADVVRWVLMWAGFKEWNVVNMGVKLKNPISFHQTDYLIDIIAHMAAQANWLFYIDQPSDHPESIGVPTFIPSLALLPPSPGMEQVTDEDLLTGVETKFTKEPLARIIRVRGQLKSKKKGGKTLGEDMTTRVMGVYGPPWAGIHTGIFGAPEISYPFGERLAGVLKHEHHFDPNVKTEDEALMMCVLIAIQMALSSFGATVEIPGNPKFGLNAQISILDTPSGTNSRLWITSISSTFATGENAEWKTTLEGVLIDTPDLLLLAWDYFALLNRIRSEYGV